MWGVMPLDIHPAKLLPKIAEMEALKWDRTVQKRIYWPSRQVLYEIKATGTPVVHLSVQCLLKFSHLAERKSEHLCMLIACLWHAHFFYMVIKPTRFS